MVRKIVMAEAPEASIAKRIVVLRGQKVMLDFDLAELYGVLLKVLIQSVKRNSIRFPGDFMFQITYQELAILKSQFVTSRLGAESGWGGRRKLPHAFSEQGVAMLSSVLRSERAIAVNIAIMRAFVRLREVANTSAELAKKLDDLEVRVGDHDEAIATIIRAIRELATPVDPTPKRRIGFL